MGDTLFHDLDIFLFGENVFFPILKFDKSQPSEETARVLQPIPS